MSSPILHEFPYYIWDEPTKGDAITMIVTSTTISLILGYDFILLITDNIFHALLYLAKYGKRIAKIEYGVVRVSENLLVPIPEPYVRKFTQEELVELGVLID